MKSPKRFGRIEAMEKRDVPAALFPVAADAPVEIDVTESVYIDDSLLDVDESDSTGAGYGGEAMDFDSDDSLPGGDGDDTIGGGSGDYVGGDDS